MNRMGRHVEMGRRRNHFVAQSICIGCLILAGCGAPDEATVLASAKAHTDGGDAATAIIELKELLQKQPDLPAARTTLGSALLAKGDAPGAEVELRRALSVGAPTGSVLPMLVQALVSQGKAGNAVAAYTNAHVEPAESEAELRTELARAQLSLGHIDAALEDVAAALKVWPEHLPAQILQARLKAADGDRVRLAATSEELVRRHPKAAQAWLLRGDSRAAGERNAARADYAKAVELNPRLAEAHSALISMDLRANDLKAAQDHVAAMRRDLPDRGETVFMEAIVAYSAGDYAHARELNQRLLRGGATNPYALLLAGQTEQRLGAYASAETLLTQASSALPDLLAARRALAELWLATGQAGRAMTVLRPALGTQLNDAATWAVAGRAYSMLGDFKAADAAFSRAAKLRPNDAAIEIERGRALVNRGQYEDGLQLLEKAANANTDPDADLALVAALMSRNDARSALQRLDRMSAAHPRLPGVEFLRGRVLESQRDTKGARKAYVRALEITPSYLPAVESLARLDLDQEHVDDARSRYLAVVDHDPKQVSALLALARLTARDPTKTEEAEAWLDKAVAVNPADPGAWLAALQIERAAGHPQVTLTRAQHAAAALPRDAEIQTALGEAQQAVGDVNQALAAFGRAAQLAPGSLPAQLRVVQGLSARGDFVGARRQLDEAARIAPDAPALAEVRVRLALAEGKPDVAAQAAVRRQQSHPREALGWLLEAEVRARQQQWSQAVALTRKALTLSHSSPVAIALYDYLGHLDEMGQRQRFEQEWLTEHPDDVAFIINQEQTEQAQGQWVAAEAHARRALALREATPLMHNNLAMMLLRRKSPEALAHAQRAVELLPDMPPLLDTLARAQAAAGQLDKAVASQERAVELAPRVGELRLQLARLYLQAGDKRKAREHLEQLVDRGDGVGSQAEVRQLLEKAGG
ncbi:MAG: PEP-CTERM system TPR-repeat protein PrsT [Burkholderiales bacterium]|nr:PEP-CTERM system TPR-repeat protein PrsT [Burkholderiales bacterium]